MVYLFFSAILRAYIFSSAVSPCNLSSFPLADHETCYDAMLHCEMSRKFVEVVL